MTTNDVESQLTELGQRWPVPSVAEAVQDRLSSLPKSPVKPASQRVLQWTGMGAVAAAIVIVAMIYLSLIATPTTLLAQVTESIRKSMSAHLQIVSTDSSGARTVGNVWYSRDLGVRGEMGDEVFLDNGQQQWTWRDADKAPAVVSRRASRDGIAMIAETLQLPNASDKPIRAAEHDQEIRGQKCVAYKVTFHSVSDPNSPQKKQENRVLVWQNNVGNTLLVRSEQLDAATGSWKTNRELSITYDVEVSSDKFFPQFPDSTKIVDEDRVWMDRFAIEKAMATTESGGLLFAVHEVSRCDNGSFYIVSSVRGTAQHLKDHPPKTRRLNLQTILLDVAEQFCAATTQQDCHVAPLASSEIDGVHYLWWLATDRNYFTIVENKRVPQSVGSKMESEEGRVRIPLMANYRGELAGSSMVSTFVTVDLPKEAKKLSLHDVALQLMKDSNLSQEGLLVHTFENATGRYVPARSITADQMVQFFQTELDWLGANDELKSANVMGGNPVPPQ